MENNNFEGFEKSQSNQGSDEQPSEFTFLTDIPDISNGNSNNQTATASAEQAVYVPDQNINVPSQNVNVPTQNINVPAQNIHQPSQNVNVPARNINVPSQNVPQQNPGYGTTPPSQVKAHKEKKQKDAASSLSLALGITSFFIFYVPIVSWVLSIISVIMGISARSKGHKNAKNMVGIILGIVSFIFSLTSMVLWFVIFSHFGDEVQSFVQYILGGLKDIYL